MHGQCDARPTVIFPACAGTKLILLGDRGTCVNSLPRAVPETEAVGRTWTRDLLIASLAPYHYTSEPHCAVRKVANATLITYCDRNSDTGRHWHSATGAYISRATRRRCQNFHRRSTAEMWHYRRGCSKYFFVWNLQRHSILTLPSFLPSLPFPSFLAYFYPSICTSLFSGIGYQLKKSAIKFGIITHRATMGHIFLSEKMPLWFWDSKGSQTFFITCKSPNHSNKVPSI